VSLAVLLLASRAGRAASAESRAAARKHSNQAQEAKKRGRLAEACSHWAEVERLDPKLPTLLELAECTEQLGRLVEAQGLWSVARDRAKHDEKPQSKARAEARLEAIQKRLAHLTLQLAADAPAGTQVLRDDAAVDATSLAGALALDPGEHSIVVKAAGHDDAKYSVRLADGEQRTLAIAAGPASAAPVAAPPASVELPAPASPPLPQRVAVPPPKPALPPSTSFWTTPRKTGAIVGAVGVVSLAGGTALCLSGDGDSADTTLALGGAALAVGGVLFVSGAVLLISAPSEAAEHARLRLTPSFAMLRGGGLVGASGDF
jgi:hypothetical protein